MLGAVAVVVVVDEDAIVVGCMMEKLDLMEAVMGWGQHVVIYNGKLCYRVHLSRL